ncbi:hypothetical protein [Congregicoccus parvus]|uniref:hypothetical protein n=1 Tax=Congregicoccus parvus TaxID=3081749 RepID=UPI003FA5EB22
MRFASLVSATLLLCSATGCAAPRSPLAGVVLTIEFPEVGLTLDTMAGWGQGPAYATVHLPDDYSASGSYPVLLFLGGSTGGDGRGVSETRRIAAAAGGGFVSVNLPIFLHEVPPLAPDFSNRWTRLDIDDDDSERLWAAYRVMLERIHAIVPNIDRQRSVMGGFSNGAHATAILLNREPAEIRQWFGRFFFYEGGERFTRMASLEGAPIAIVQGMNQPNHWQRPLHVRAVEAGVRVEWIELEGVGHEFTNAGVAKLGDWIRRHR